jgi:hypothetical protein
MSTLIVLAQTWPERVAPEAAGAAGLGLALLTIAVLVVQQVRASWQERTSPGPVPERAPVQERESRALYWPIAVVLVAVLGVIVIERIVVLT